ncbi:MAG: TonB-dependent receptor, partial [Edaphobacter sp.]
MGGPVFSSNVIPLTINIPGCVSGVDTFLQCMTANGGHLPPSAINPISATLAKSYIPGPNSGVNTFAFSPTATSTTDQYIGRVDYNLTPRDQIYAVYIRQKNLTLDTLPFTGATVPGSGDQSTTIIDQGSLGYTRQISSTMVNDFEVHYTRFNFDAVEPQKSVAPSSVGFDISPQNTAGQGLPFIAFTGNGDSIDAAGKIAYPQPTLSLGFSTNGPQPRIDQVYQLNDSISKNLGHHNLKFGYDLRRYNVSNPFSARNNGSFAFDASAATGNPNSSGDAALDFLLGIPATYSQGSGAPIQAYAFLNYFYAQDTWKATTSLTLSYGLGYQIDTPLHNRQFGGIGVTCFNPGVQSKVFPSAPKNLVFPGDPGCNDATGAVTRYSDFGPRIGFAWAPDLGILSGGSSRKLSLRGGYGIYYNRTEEETSLQNLQDPPFGVNSAGAGDYATSSTIYPSFANPYQDINTPGPAGLYKSKFPFVAPAAGSSPDFGAFLPFGLSQYNPSFRSPYSENVQLTFE